MFIRMGLVSLVLVRVAFSQGANLASLRSALIPEPSNLSQYVQDPQTLAALGKILFWDVQIGSDGATACATCHFHAGADHRAQNQLASPHDSKESIRPNRTLTLADFPFRLFTNPQDQRSPLVRDNRIVFGSAGVVARRFVEIASGSAFDTGLEDVGGANFAIDGTKTRQVTGRNTPSVINSVYYVRNFWDGRASSIFSGATPFGDSDTGFNAVVWKDGRLQQERVSMDNASLASQAVGPALNDVEMSYAGRTWTQLGRKVLNLPPLALQRVAVDDSLLGAMANPDGNGLVSDYTYASLIRKTFRPEYWQSDIAEDGYLQVERNFPLFFGLAIQAYESLLISGATPFDQFMEGNRAALSSLEQAGMNVFAGGNSECHECHMGPEMSAASFTNFRRRAGGRSVSAASPDDLGFFRTGVSLIGDDVGGAGLDPFGRPLFSSGRGNASGVFKTPGLRNVELTGPYFHSGSQSTLEQVMEFYSRQGDFPEGGNLGPGMGRIRLSDQERISLVAFMKTLTDDRVRFERAPFDHPALCVPIGHVESAGELKRDDSSPATQMSALDRWALIPAVGKSGNSVPLQTFEELLSGVGSDGSRAHTLTESCMQ